MDFTKSSNEQIIWQGSPEFKPYLKTGFIEFLRELRFFVFTWTLFIVLSKVGKYELNWTLMYLIAFSIIGSGIYTISKKLIAFKETAYFITNKRVVIKKGKSGSSMISLEKSKITFVDLKTNKIEKRYNAGTVLIHLGEVKNNDGFKEKVFYKLESIKEPYKVLNLF